MKLKGISVYTGLSDYNIEDTIAYLKKASEYGINFAFTSMHMPEQNVKNTDFEKILEASVEYNVPLVIDVSKPMMDHFTIPKNLGALRLDYGFTKEDVVKLSHDLPLIELNASTISIKYLNELKELGADFSHIRISHNFYPKPFTGLDIYDVKAKNKLFKEYGLTVLAYMASNSGKRPPLYKGLPTIEEHRNMSLELQMKELVAAGCDGVCVGDAYISDEDFKVLQETDLEFIAIPIDIYPDITNEELENLKLESRFRVDEGSYIKRSGRKTSKEILPKRTIDITPNMVTIDNINLKRYMGEVNITKRFFKNDGSINVLGYINESGYTLVDLMDPGSKFTFKIVGEILDD